LEPRDLEAIIANEQLYEKYVDALMFVHDVLCEFSATQGPPRFPQKEAIEEQMQHLFADPVLVGHPTLLAHISSNYQQAQTIRQQAEQSHTAQTVFAVEKEATLFLESLLQLYRLLRTTRGTATFKR
jgi:hypothetical protein